MKKDNRKIYQPKKILFMDKELVFSKLYFNIIYVEKNKKIRGRRASNTRKIQLEDGRVVGHFWANKNLRYVGICDEYGFLLKGANENMKKDDYVINPATGFTVKKGEFLEKLAKEGLTYDQFCKRYERWSPN